VSAATALDTLTHRLDDHDRRPDVEPSAWLTGALRADARDDVGTQAAIDLLVAHGRWLERPDFRDHLVVTDREHTSRPLARVHWPAVPAFLADAPCAASEARVLALAAELAGTDVARPLAALLAGLDDRNAALVARAVAHVLSRGGRR
jgi:hypothetical protein